MKNKSKLTLCILFAAAAFFAIFGGICLYYGLLGEYDDALGHFARDAFFAPISYVCLALGAVIGIAGWILFSKREALDEDFAGGVVYKIVNIAIALSVLFDVFMQVRAGFASVPVKGKVFFFASLAFEALSVVYFLVSAIVRRRGEKASALVSLLSFAPVIFCALRVLYMYFDQTVAVNSPVKLICQLTYIVYMLTFCAETGLSLGRGKIYPRYIFALSCGITVGGIGSIAALAAYILGTDATMLVGTDAPLKVLMFIYCAYALVAAMNIETREKTKETTKE